MPFSLCANSSWWSGSENCCPIDSLATNQHTPLHKTQNTDAFCRSASGNPDPFLMSTHVPDTCYPTCFFSVCSTSTNNVVGKICQIQNSLTQQAISLWLEVDTLQKSGDWTWKRFLSAFCLERLNIIKVTGYSVSYYFGNWGKAGIFQGSLMGKSKIHWPHPYEFPFPFILCIWMEQRWH